MANPEHLEKLKQGVDGWNRWREKNREITPDLTTADLSQADLSNADLSMANLRGTNLGMASLIGANLSMADLSYAYLSYAYLNDSNLSGANLYEADFDGADFNGTNFSGAKLNGVDLSGSDLSEVDLSGTQLCGAKLVKVYFDNANLSGANLCRTNLGEAELSRADLSYAKLSGANLHLANLSKADLTGADFCEADLSKANLSKADLSIAEFSNANFLNARLNYSLLIGSKFDNVNLTGVTLYGSARDDWEIDGIKCDYVYWDLDGEIRTPKDGNFEPGEFEKLYKQLPTFEYIFEHGCGPIDAIIIDKVVQDIRHEHPAYQLQVDNFSFRTNPRVYFTVAQQEVVESAFNLVKIGFEKQLDRIERNTDDLKQMRSTKHISVTTNNSYYNEVQAAAVGPNAHANDVGLNPEIDYKKLVYELSRIQAKIKKETENSKAENASYQVAKAKIEAKNGNGAKVLEHLKKAGKWTLGVAEKIGTPIATELLKKSVGI